MVSPVVPKNRRPRNSDVESDFGSVQGETDKEEEEFNPDEPGAIDLQELSLNEGNKAPSGKGTILNPISPSKNLGSGGKGPKPLSGPRSNAARKQQGNPRAGGKMAGPSTTNSTPVTESQRDSKAKKPGGRQLVSTNGQLRRGQTQDSSCKQQASMDFHTSPQIVFGNLSALIADPITTQHGHMSQKSSKTSRTESSQLQLHQSSTTSEDPSKKNIKSQISADTININSSNHFTIQDNPYTKVNSSPPSGSSPPQAITLAPKILEQGILISLDLEMRELLDGVVETIQRHEYAMRVKNTTSKACAD